MRNTKGQALVEFVIILPVMLILVFCIVDFGRVITTKNELENVSSDVITYYQSGTSLSEIKTIINKNHDNVVIQMSQADSYTNVTITKKISPITPGFNKIKNSVFDVKVTRVIKND